MGFQKLGQPEPDSYLASELNNGNPQPAHANVPSSFSSFRGLLKGLSVPFSRIIRYCSGVSVCFHSASLLVTFCTPFALIFWLRLFPSWLRLKRSGNAVTIITAPSATAHTKNKRLLMMISSL